MEKEFFVRYRAISDYMNGDPEYRSEFTTEFIKANSVKDAIEKIEKAGKLDFIIEV